MKIASTINRYLFIEMILPFVISVAFFTFIFLLSKMLDITSLIVNYGISISDIFMLLIYSIPRFFELVIPMSVMMAVLLTFLRLSEDNEIVALKASGVSIYGMLPPVFLFCLIGCLLTGFMTIYGAPWGRLAFKELTYEVAVAHPDIGIRERVFNDNFKGVMLYVNRVDFRNKELTDIFIEDRRIENTVSAIIAPGGRLLSEPDSHAFRLRLYNGIVNQVDLERMVVHSTSFDTYEINLGLDEAVLAAKGGLKDEKEMSLAELRQYLKTAATRDVQYYSALIEFHKRFSIPFACFALGLLAVSLGLQSRSAKRSFGLGLGLILFLLYYLILSMGRAFGETGAYPPAIGMWAPNIIMGSIGLYLIVRIANDRPLRINFSQHFSFLKIGKNSTKA